MVADEASLTFSVAHADFSLKCRWSKLRYDLELREVRP